MPAGCAPLPQNTGDKYEERLACVPRPQHPPTVVRGRAGAKFQVQRSRPRRARRRRPALRGLRRQQFRLPTERGPSGHIRVSRASFHSIAFRERLASSSRRGAHAVQICGLLL